MGDMLLHLWPPVFLPFLSLCPAACSVHPIARGGVLRQSVGQRCQSGHRCERNIISYDGGAASLYTVRQITTDTCRFSSNLMHCAGGLPRLAGIPRGATQANWEEWLAMGQDRGSLLGDPKFVSAAARDYLLQPDSPALRAGIQDAQPRRHHGSGEWAIGLLSGQRRVQTGECRWIRCHVIERPQAPADGKEQAMGRPMDFTQHLPGSGGD